MKKEQNKEIEFTFTTLSLVLTNVITWYLTKEYIGVVNGETVLELLLLAPTLLITALYILLVILYKQNKEDNNNDN